MAYTAPPSVAVGDVLTATYLNTYVKANFEYLKGTAGTVQIDNTALLKVASGAVQMGLSADSTYAGGALGAGLQLYRDTGANGTSYIWHRGTGNCFLGTQEAAPFLITTSNVPRVTVASDGKVGIGGTPLLPLDVTATSGGHFGAYPFSAQAGTLTTIMAAGTVTGVLEAFWAVKPSSGTAGASGAFVGHTPTPTNTNIYSSGSDILTFSVATNGSVTLQRTGGSLTYSGMIIMFWI